MRDLPGAMLSKISRFRLWVVSGQLWVNTAYLAVSFGQRALSHSRITI